MLNNSSLPGLCTNLRSPMLLLPMSELAALSLVLLQMSLRSAPSWSKGNGMHVEVLLWPVIVVILATVGIVAVVAVCGVVILHQGVFDTTFKGVANSIVCAVVC